MKKIVIASNNAGKLREIRAILAPFGLDAISQKEAGFDAEVEETGTTFAENAALKAHAVHEALHCAVIADDSGLLVDALDGAPGVYSHRFAGENATDAQRCEKLLELLKDTPAEKRTARFQCVLCYVNAAGEEQFFSGSVSSFGSVSSSGSAFSSFFRMPAASRAACRANAIAA
jgi:XTP/dITP diphosphohydrolase